MATAKMKLYPYVRVSPKGELQSVNAFTWKTEDKVEDSGSFCFELPPIELDVEVAEDFRPACVQLLRAHRGKLQAEHHMLMTRMQFQENQLLAISAPEVLDASEGPKAKAINQDGEGDDDIPF